MTLNSAYVWQGLNLFASIDDQGKPNRKAQHMMLTRRELHHLRQVTAGCWGACRT